MFNKIFGGPTPHGNASQHLQNMYGYFLLPSLVVLWGHFGVVSTFWSGLFGAIITAAIGLGGGLAITAVTRHTFNLIQTGRVFQYLAFWLTSWFGLVVSAALFGSLTLASPVLASLIIWVAAFGLATAFGEVPRRTWLPVRKRK